MEISASVGFSDFERIYLFEPVFGCDLGCDVIVEPLQGITHIAVFPDFPIKF
jgi:hypothetical protein